MKKCLLSALLFCCFSQSFAVGEIAFTSYRTSGGDQFSFLTTVDLPANFQINFTDSGWLNDDSGFRVGEGIITWIGPAAIVPAGTHIVINVETGNVVSGVGSSS